MACEAEIVNTICLFAGFVANEKLVYSLSDNFTSLWEHYWDAQRTVCSFCWLLYWSRIPFYWGSKGTLLVNAIIVSIGFETHADAYDTFFWLSIFRKDIGTKTKIQSIDTKSFMRNLQKMDGVGERERERDWILVVIRKTGPVATVRKKRLI